MYNSVSPRGSSTTVYDNVLRAQSTIDALSCRTTAVFDAAGRTVGQIDARGFRTATVYNAASVVVASINALGNRVTTVFGTAGRFIASAEQCCIARRPTRLCTARLQRAERPTVIDANGNQRIVKSPDGTRVTTTWNYENQPTQYNQPANVTYPVVTMSYNADNLRVQKKA